MADQGRVNDADDPTVAARYKLNDIFCAAWLSHAISALAEHRIPDIIGNDPISVDQIAVKAKLHKPSLYRALRAASANGIFAEVGDGVFEHTEASRMLCASHPASWKGMALMWNHPSCLRAWSEFAQVLTDGRSGIEHAFGVPLYQHLSNVPGGTRAFSDAMISNSAQVSSAIAKSFRFDRFSTVTDLGGGVGTLLAAILEEHQNVHGIILELEELKNAAEDYFAFRGLTSRTKFVAGNFLKSIPPGSDLYMIKNSLWNWGDEQCLAILNNARKAIGTATGSRLLIIEYMIDEKNAPWATLYDLQILNLPGGKARSIAEYTDLLAKTGFVSDLAQYVQDQTLLIARPV